MTSPRTKAGVYIPAELLMEAEELMRALGVRSRSRLVQEALRLFIAENKWRLTGRAAGIIGVVYDHSAREADHELTEIQHKHLGVVVSALHVHLDRYRCMLAVAVRGDVEEIAKMIGEMHNVRGVEVIRPILLSSGPPGEPAHGPPVGERSHQVGH
ncbi:MAG: CopG family transcriptional regulator [Thermoprotei archaeon]|nr:MAG: CopG family transcriptional regulator [Thermoprotei archaeon]